ncbi:MAG: VOC family protein [Pseudolabrys sp.]|nr:VOC family protein [Pseudolabrys sp.]
MPHKEGNAIPRGIDHVVHAVRDLDAAATLYRRLGFMVGARNRHSWGTHNHVVQTPGAFVELLAIADPSLITPHRPQEFSFGAFNQDFLIRGEGLSMLVLEGRGVADIEDFRNKGIGDFRQFDFAREAKAPDGKPINVAFTLAFAHDAQAPEVGFFTCQHHHPENFWNRAFQQHPNGTMEIRAVMMATDNPQAHREFLAAFTGSGEFYTEPGEVSVLTPRGAVCVMTPKRFAAAFGGPLPRFGAHLQAIRFAVADIAAARALLKANAVPYRDHRDGFVVDAADALGATISFESAVK